MPRQGISEIRVAVLPIENLSSNGNLAYFARGFSEDLVTDLSRFAGISVISSHSTRNLQSAFDKKRIQALAADYIVQGSFRLDEARDHVRIGIQLLHANDASLLWADRYQDHAARIFDIQDEIVRQVVNSLQKHIEYDLLSSSYRKESSSLDTYDHWLRGMEELRKGGVEHDEVAREHFERALETDPHYSRAYTGLSLSYFNEWSCQLWDRWEISQKGAHEYALKAIELNENDYLALAVLGRTYLYAGEYEKAEHCLRKSLRLNPNDADNIIQISSCMTYLGYVQEAMKLYERAVSLNPLHPTWYLSYGTLISIEAGETARAIQLGKRVPIDTSWIDFCAMMAAACYLEDDPEEMKVYWQNFVEQHRVKILRSDTPDPREALRWFTVVNPYRYETRMQPFIDYMFDAYPEVEVSDPGRSQGENVFCRDNDIWHLQYAGKRTTVKDVKGLHDIAKMLAQPGKEFHCAELMGVTLQDGDAPNILDQKARKEYQQRVRDLQSEIADAEDRNDLQYAADLQAEYETLIGHLSSSLGLSNAPRKTKTHVERARSAVTWRIRSAIQKVGEVHDTLGRHLDQSVKTGTLCSYHPEKPIDWTL